MKKYISNIHIFGLLLMAGLAFTACSNDNDEIENKTVEPVANKVATDSATVYTMTLEASKGEEAESRDTRALALNGTTITSSWTAGDMVTVYNGDTSIGTLTAQSSGASTTLSGTLTTTGLKANDELTLKYLSPSYATQDGTLTGRATSIDKTCDYSTAIVTIASIEGNKITTTADANFVNQQAIVKFTVKNNTGTATATTKLVITVDGNNYTVTPATATSELYVALPAMSGKTMRLVATVSSATYVYMKSNVTFAKGNYYTRGVKMKVPTYPLALSDLTTTQTEYVGSVIGSDGNIYANADAATAAGKTPCAAIAYIGAAVDKYFNKCIAIALNDGYSGTSYDLTYYQALTATGNYASSHGIKVGETTYNANTVAANYDKVANSNQTSSKTRGTKESLVQGWRIPSVTEWRYIFEGLGGVSATDPVGIDDDPYGNGSILAGTINTICGNTNMTASGGYWSSSYVDNSHAWCYSFGSNFFYGQDLDATSRVRPIFAY